MAQTTYDTAAEERALIVSLSLVGSEDDMARRLSELRELAMTAGARGVGDVPYLLGPSRWAQPGPTHLPDSAK